MVIFHNYLPYFFLFLSYMSIIFYKMYKKRKRLRYFSIRKSLSLHIIISSRYIKSILQSCAAGLQVFLQRLCLIQLLPRKIQVIAAEMSVCSRLLVDRASEVEHLYDACRAEIKVLAEDLNQLRI